MLGWLLQHRIALLRAFSQLARQPVAHLIGVLVIAFALSLPAGALRLIDRAASLGQGALHEPHLTLFMKQDADDAAVRAVWDTLALRTDVREFRYISNTEALAEMKAMPGLVDAISALDRNPLPHTFVVLSRSPAPQALENLRAALAGLAKVERVQVDSAWAKRLDALVQFARRGAGGLTVLLAVAMAFTVFSTVRQQVLSSSSEIEITHLIGATPGYIRRPFLYFGVLQGWLGSLAAGLLLWLGSRWFNDAVQPLSNLFAMNLQLPALSLREWVLLGAAGMGWSWASAYLSVSLTLRRIAARC
ncbi:MAG: permease-like cell division protein FtsX [Betaproteobacteria bacterium]|nr:permease-like cell division protein FtsX [Betaproteobacteria bacterium]